ncbi:MAG: slipin family protein [Chthonomonadales bacterium]|nr:slipin family protein [Chthonomonadales bacterium]
MQEILLWILNTIGVVGAVVVVLAIVILPASIRILPAWERAVILRLGKFNRVTGPGVIILIPYVDTAIRVNTRIMTMDVPRQEMMTRDNVPVTVDAIVLFKVIEPQSAVLNIEDYIRTTSLIAQTTLRSTIGQIELDELLAQRDHVNQRLQTVIDEQTEPFGVKVTAVEVRDVSLPDTMKRAMAAQAESERERRAKVINALGEFEAAEKLTQAAALIGKEPAALQLRFLQSVREIASERATMTILPLPLDLITPFIDYARRQSERDKPDA